MQVHASCVLVGRHAVLIRGASGMGKSTLATALVETASDNSFRALVADDRVDLRVASGRLIASAPLALRGLLERRGLGIVRLPTLERAVVALLVDLADEGDAPRMPEPPGHAELLGVHIPHLTIPAVPNGASLVVAAMAHLNVGQRWPLLLV